MTKQEQEILRLLENYKSLIGTLYCEMCASRDAYFTVLIQNYGVPQELAENMIYSYMEQGIAESEENLRGCGKEHGIKQPLQRKVRFIKEEET